MPLTLCSTSGSVPSERSMEPPIPALMTAAEDGDEGSAEKLFTALYSELRRIASRELRRGAGPAAALRTTSLLHEAYLDIAQRNGPTFPDRARFMGYASRVMRGLIIDHARNRRAQKRGGQFAITLLEEEMVGDGRVDHEELTRVSDALEVLGKVDRDLAQVVDLKFFCGFSTAEIAAMRGVSERTVKRSWEKARIYLHGVMSDGQTTE